MSAPFPKRGQLWFVLLALALLASLVLNGLLLGTARYFYARELAVRLQPTGSSPVRSAGDGLRVLFLGDSRAAAWPDLPTNQFRTLNAGIQGQTTAQVRLRAEALLDSEKPSVVVLQAGINDLKAIGVLPRQMAGIQSECESNLTELVELCRHHHAGVVLTLILPPGQISWARQLVWSDQINSALLHVNAALARKYAEAADVAVLDCPALLDSVSNHADSAAFYYDSLHLTAAGYARLQPELIRSIEKLAAPENKNTRQPDSIDGR